jgi:plasmid stabilization system protein ParE
MADDPSLKVVLQRIVNARVHPVYETANAEAARPEDLIGKDVSIVRAFARRLLTLDLDGILPPQPQQLPNQVAAYVSAYLSNVDQNAFRENIIAAHAATKGLAGAFDQISDMPRDGHQSKSNRENFLLCAGRFVIGWSILFPSLEAVAGGDIPERTRKVLEEAERHGTEIKNILATSRTAVSEIGAEKHAQEFSNLCKNYQKRANRWLAFTILAAVLFAVLVIASGYWTFSIPRDEYGKLAQVVVGKVLLLGVAYYLIVFCSRSYRANAHLAAINLHRATALQVFKTFAESSDDEQTKNAILLETTRCIYSHTSTGFLTGEDPSSPVQVVEILKALAPNRPT